MANFDQLEIISPGGVIEFFDLHPSRGVTNIGSHGENDVVLLGSNIAPFHAVVDHRYQPFQLMLLADESQTRLGGRLLPPGAPVPLQNWDSIEIGGHTLILLQGRNGDQPAAPAPQPTTPRVTYAAPAAQPSVAPQDHGRPFADPRAGMAASASVVAPTVAAVTYPPAVIETQPDGDPYGAQPMNGNSAWQEPRPFNPLLAPVRDQIDELIIVSLLEREQIVDVDQTIAYQLTIINGGELVASFDVRVEGVDPSWVVILPAQINLNEAESGIVTITVTPPRLYTSSAGRHNLSFTISAPDYPGRFSQLGATLVVNPYHDLQISELSHKRQTLTWGKPVGETFFTLVNGGNSIAQVQVEAQDEERACHFEFQLADQGMTYARQAELRLAPGEATEVALMIEPNDRSLISMRNRTYQYDVRATPLGGQQFPRTIGGQVRVVPLIGKGLILLFLVLMVSLAIVILSPQVRTFDINPKVVDWGTPVYLNWEASRFSQVKLNGAGLGNVTPEPIGTAELLLQRSQTYSIEADNFISRLGLPSIYNRTDEVSVQVRPVEPLLDLQVSQRTITSGESVRINWSVRGANRALILVDGNPTPLPTEQFDGSFTFSPDTDMEFQLIASNPSVVELGTPAVERRASVSVVTPTPTPLPEPAILVFSVSPIAITAGQQANLEWRVADAPNVSIEGVGDGLPAEGTRPLFPMQTTTYVLRAQTGGGQVIEEVTVFVQPQPTATTTPQAPGIEFFQVNPKEIVSGNDEPVKLSWSIRGDVTAIEIFSPDLRISTALSRTGTIPIFPEKSTFFILTATNRDQSSTAQVEVNVLPAPTPTPTVTTTPIPPTPVPTATPIPRPGITFFGAESGESPARPDEVTLLGGTNYQMLVGSLIKLNWSTTSATRVVLRAAKIDNSTIDYGNRPLSGDFTFRFDGTIRSFELTAFNEPPDGSGSFPTVSQAMTIQANQIRPTAPFALVGVGEETQNRLSWSYDPQYLDKIRAFKVYRASTGDMSFFPAVELNPSATSWIDTTQPICNRVYFVVATYTDVEGNILETEPTATSWFSPVCQ
ncbi:MAG: FHA domain-containing protein [Caldilineaceae bacterium]|nr:FHA domain-containing protein [Caldilineaceae bacterium]